MSGQQVKAVRRRNSGRFDLIPWLNALYNPFRERTPLFSVSFADPYLKNSGKLEVAQQIANHESPRTTKLYDRRTDEISLDEIERITIYKKPGVKDSGLLRNVDPGPSWSVGFSYYLAIEPALSFAFLVFWRKAFSPGLRDRLTPVMGRF